MAQFILKRGNLAGLANLPVKDGQFIVVKDERSIYVDTEAGRIRLGDFQEFASIEALNNNVNPSTTALYYVSDVNVLAKWNGSEYIQINRDTGATSVEVVGDGNAVTAASYNAVTRKLTLTKGTVFATKAELEAEVERATGAEAALDKEIDDLAKKVNDLEVVGGQANVIESVKVNGEALEVVDKAVNVVVPTGALASKDTVEKSDLSASVQASLDKADSALQSHQDISHLAVKADVQTELGKKVDKVEGKSLIADSEIERLAGVHNYDDTALAGRVSTVEGKVSTLEGASATYALKTEVQAVDAKFANYNTTVAQKAIDDAQDAKIKAIEDTYLVEADIANFETKENVKKVADDLAAYVTSNDAALAGVKATADAAAVKTVVDAALELKADKSALAETDATLAEVKQVVDNFFSDSAVADDVIDTLKDIATYIANDKEGAADIAASIGSLEEKVEVIEGKPAYGITEAQISNWDNEVGAKALAESKTTSAEVKDQIEAYGYATESDLTLAENRITALEGVKDDYKAADLALKSELEGKIADGDAATLAAAKEDAAKQDVVVLATAQGYADQAKADAIADAASKYETIGTAQGIVDSLKLADTYEAKGTAADLIEGLDLENTYEAKGTAQDIVDGLDLENTYEAKGTAANAIAALDLPNTYEAKGAAATVEGKLTAYQTSNNEALAAVKATAEAAYVKPATGIAKSDLASDVQTSLGKADTALQPEALTWGEF